MTLAVYLAPFEVRLRRMLQYREAAFAGFVTQLWWGGLKVMILAGFYGTGTRALTAPLTVGQSITYVWLAQGLLALTPWSADPEVAAAVRDGSVVHDRLRPVDTYAYWYARAAAWLLGRAIPRLVLMIAAAGLVLPALGLSAWGIQPPASAHSLSLALVSLALGLLTSAAMVALVNAAVVAIGVDRPVNLLTSMLVILLSGNEIPLPLMPDSLQPFLRAQPLAGILDTPFRVYLGVLNGRALAQALVLQGFWIVALIVLGRAWLARAFARLEVNGG